MVSEEQLVPQARFEGYAIIEMMGHRQEIGFVTTQAFGPAVLFRVDTPELAAREYVLDRPGYATYNNVKQWCPAGTKVQRSATPPKSCLVSPNSLYAINPCSEEVALKAIERSINPPLIVLEMPPGQPALPAADYGDDGYSGDGDDEQDD